MTIDADAIPDSCAIGGMQGLLGSSTPEGPPPRTAVTKGDMEVSIAGARAVKSGHAVTFTLTAKNVSDHAINLRASERGAFQVQAKNEAHKAVEQLAACQSAFMFKSFQLRSGGVLTKKIVFRAEMVRADCSKGTRKRVGPLPSGDYRMTISLPWARKPFSAPLKVTD